MVLEEPQVKTTLVDATKVVDAKYPAKCQYLFKMESEQPSGSFKLRGIGHLIGKKIEELKAQGVTNVQVFSSSGGNAGLAAAYASRHYGVQCTVVLPIFAKTKVVELLKGYGAQVILHGKHWGEADAYMNEYAQKDESSGTIPIVTHPFNHPDLWEGHGDLIDEVVQELTSDQLSKVKGVVCSVGGGGLYNGVVAGLERNGLSQIPVLAVEAKGVPTFTKAIEAGKSVTLSELNPIVSSLGSPYISEQSMKNYKTHKTIVHLLDEQDCFDGTVDYYKLFNKVVEPACGATLVTAFSRADLLDQYFGPLSPEDIVLFIVCGGVVYSEEDVQALIK